MVRVLCKPGVDADVLGCTCELLVARCLAVFLLTHLCFCLAPAFLFLRLSVVFLPLPLPPSAFAFAPLPLCLRLHLHHRLCPAVPPSNTHICLSTSRTHAHPGCVFHAHGPDGAPEGQDTQRGAEGPHVTGACVRLRKTPYSTHPTPTSPSPVPRHHSIFLDERSSHTHTTTTTNRTLAPPTIYSL